MVTLDGQNLFGEQTEIETGPLKRDSMEKSVAGLDGVLSIYSGHCESMIGRSTSFAGSTMTCFTR